MILLTKWPKYGYISQMYKLELTDTAKKSFDHIMRSDTKLGTRLANAINRLIQAPSLGVPLRGELKGLLKYRVGNYRILYQIHKTKLIITVIDIGHRREIYR